LSTTQAPVVTGDRAGQLDIVVYDWGAADECLFLIESEHTQGADFHDNFATS
jgi:hypothetical protein